MSSNADARLGVPLHPCHRSITDQLDELENSLDKDVVAIAVSRHYAIPSTKFAASQYPAALSRHLMSLIPPARPPDQRSPEELDHQDNKQTQGTSVGSAPAELSNDLESGSSTPFSMPSIAFNMKLNWPGYLTLKGLGKKSPQSGNGVLPTEEPKEEAHQEAIQAEQTDVDTGALEDAISETIAPTDSQEMMHENQGILASISSTVQWTDAIGSATGEANQTFESAAYSPPPTPQPRLSTCYVHLPVQGDGINTHRRKIRYYTVRRATI